MSKKGNSSLGELCAVCKSYKKETSKFLTYKGYTTICLECKPRAEITRLVLRMAESKRS